MKTRKNYVLASLAIVTGISAALASARIPVNPKVLVKLTSASAFTCQPSGASCESNGMFACRVRVTVTKSGSSVPTTIIGHDVTSCTLLLANDVGTTQASSLVVYDAKD